MAVVTVAVVSRLSRRARGARGCGRAVLDVTHVVPCRRRFVSLYGGCDTPTNASVCNGFGGVCVVSICLTFARRV